jgi:exodeoxyribonuclease VII small subunit
MKKTTQALQAELDAIIAWFESDDADIDQATAQYARGLEVAKELKKRLENTKNEIAKLTQAFDADR